jgi:hypothetical protein
MKIHASYKKYVNLIKERNLNMIAYSNLVGKNFSFTPDEIAFDATQMACKDLVFNQVMTAFPWG